MSARRHWAVRLRIGVQSVLELFQREDVRAKLPRRHPLQPRNVDVRFPAQSPLRDRTGPNEFRRKPRRLPPKIPTLHPTPMSGKFQRHDAALRELHQIHHVRRRETDRPAVPAGHALRHQKKLMRFSARGHVHQRPRKLAEDTPRKKDASMQRAAMLRHPARRHVGHTEIRQSRLSHRLR